VHCPVVSVSGYTVKQTVHISRLSVMEILGKYSQQLKLILYRRTLKFPATLNSVRQCKMETNIKGYNSKFKFEHIINISRTYESSSFVEHPYLCLHFPQHDRFLKQSRTLAERGHRKYVRGFKLSTCNECCTAGYVSCVYVRRTEW